jgi:hypothetical protein
MCHKLALAFADGAVAEAVCLTIERNQRSGRQQQQRKRT